MQAFRLTFQHLESINPFAREVSGTFKIEFLSLLEKILLILGEIIRRGFQSWKFKEILSMKLTK